MASTSVSKRRWLGFSLVGLLAAAVPAGLAGCDSGAEDGETIKQPTPPALVDERDSDSGERDTTELFTPAALVGEWNSNLFSFTFRGDGTYQVVDARLPPASSTYAFDGHQLVLKTPYEDRDTDAQGRETVRQAFVRTIFDVYLTRSKLVLSPFRPVGEHRGIIGTWVANQTTDYTFYYEDEAPGTRQAELTHSVRQFEFRANGTVVSVPVGQEPAREATYQADPAKPGRYFTSIQEWGDFWLVDNQVLSKAPPAHKATSRQ